MMKHEQVWLFIVITVRAETNAKEAKLVYVKLKKAQHLDFHLKKNNWEKMFWLFFFPR